MSIFKKIRTFLPSALLLLQTSIQAPAADAIWTAANFASHGVRGFNVGAINYASMAGLSATGANVVRVAVPIYQNCNSASYNYDLTGVNNAITYAQTLGYRVIITLEPFTCTGQWDNYNYWNDVNLQNNIASNWEYIAWLYKGNPIVAGYDLINEPIAPNGEAQWVAFATKLINYIRAIDPDHVIIFEPSPGGIGLSFGAGFLTAPLPFSNIVYSLHFYEPYEITTQGLQGLNTQENYPSPSYADIGLVNKTSLSNLMGSVVQFSQNFNVPILVGEFGCIRWAPNNSAYNYVADAISLFEAAGFSWTITGWQPYQGWDPQLPESFFYQYSYINAQPQIPTIVLDQVAAFGAYRSNTTDTMSLLIRYFSQNIKVTN